MFAAAVLLVFLQANPIDITQILQPPPGAQVTNPPCPCAKSSVNAFDRWAVKDRDSRMDIASTVLVSLAAAIPTFYDTATGNRDLTEARRIGQAVAINTAMIELFKRTITSPRPFAYFLKPGDPLLYEGNTYENFPSGHASTAMVIASAFGKNHPKYKWYGYGLAGAVAFLRVGAGQHKVSAVLVGLGMGYVEGLMNLP